MNDEAWKVLIRDLSKFYLGSMICLTALAITAIIVVAYQ